ncbi:MAG: hypothetical protein DIU70_010220 [Bacillota bacterium]|nr:MAG: hypothetical protein DIU70_01225 [Bacillota bacterium]
MERVLTGVTLPRRWPSLLGALEGMLAAVRGGPPVPPAVGIDPADYLLGLSGLAFYTCVDLVVSSEGPTAYNFHQLLPLWERLRVWFRYTGSAPGEPQMAALRDQAREQIRQSLDRGWPAIAYDLGGLAEYGLVVGLEGDRLLALRPAGPPEPVTVSLADLPPADHPWSKLEVITAVAAEPDFDPAPAEEAAVRFAVDHGWAPPSRDGWYYFGLRAYQAWRTALGMPRHAPGTAQGMAYCAEYLWHVRQGAARFCRYLAESRGWAAAGRAAEAYAEAAEHLATVRAILPFAGPAVPGPSGTTTGAEAAGGSGAEAVGAGVESVARAEAALADPGQRKAVANALYRAQQAEERALAALEEVLRGLRW